MPCEIGPYNRILDFGKTHFILERVLYSKLLCLISPDKDYTNLSNYYFSSSHFKKKQKVQASFLTSHH